MADQRTQDAATQYNIQDIQDPFYVRFLAAPKTKTHLAQHMVLALLLALSFLLAFAESLSKHFGISFLIVLLGIGISSIATALISLIFDLKSGLKKPKQNGETNNHWRLDPLWSVLTLAPWSLLSLMPLMILFALDKMVSLVYYHFKNITNNIFPCFSYSTYIWKLRNMLSRIFLENTFVILMAKGRFAF